MQSEKIRTVVRIAGKDYTIASYDSAEYVGRVAAHVDRKMSELGVATRLPPAQLAVLTAVNATDDMMKSRDDIDRLRRENDGLRDALDKLREQLSTAEGEAAREIERLHAALQARDDEIERLTAAISEGKANA